MSTTLPVQYAPSDGTLTGPVDGVYSFRPFPSVLQFTPDDAIHNYLLFRNGLLIHEYADYAAGPGYFAMPAIVGTNVFTARSYQSPSASKLTLSTAGITAVGTLLVWLSPFGPVDTTAQPLMLFRNSRLLTSGSDYTKNGPWITLTSGQQIVPATDTWVAVIGMGGSACSTFDGTITGTIDGNNKTYVLPSGTTGEMLFVNGLLQTLQTDYTRSGATVVLQVAPQMGDTLTAQAFSAAAPAQLTTADNSLTFAVAESAWVFSEGLLLTQVSEAVVSGDTVLVSGA